MKQILANILHYALLNFYERNRFTAILTHTLKKDFRLFKMLTQSLMIFISIIILRINACAFANVFSFIRVSGSYVHPACFLYLGSTSRENSRYWFAGLSSFRQPSAAQIVSNVHRTIITDVTHVSHGVAVAVQASRLNKSVLVILEDDRDEN